MKLNEDKRKRVYVQVRDATKDKDGKVKSQSITVYDTVVERVVAMIKKAVRSAT